MYGLKREDTLMSIDPETAGLNVSTGQGVKYARVFKGRRDHVDDNGLIAAWRSRKKPCRTETCRLDRLNPPFP